jgi:hypothetical protein
VSVTSDTEIVNSALNKLGAERILSLDDASVRARIMKTQYPIRRDALLQSHPWNFAISYVELAAVSPTPSDLEWEYTYVFQLPSDCLRVFKTDLNFNDEWEEIEGNRIACNVSTLKIKYIKRITDVSKFSARFCETLAYDLAADTAMALTGSSEKKKDAVEEFNKYLAQTRSFDAQVGSIKRVESDDWVTSRRY